MLFGNALRVAKNRELLAAGGGDVGENRRAFAAEIREALRRIDAIDALVRARRAGLID